MFGPVPFKPYDYVVVPRCTTYRLDFAAGVQPNLLVIEAAGSVVIPPKYLNPEGQLRLGAPYYERDLHGPKEIEVIDREEDTPVLIKDGQRLSRYVLDSHPFDVSAGRHGVSLRSTPTISSRSPARFTSPAGSHVRGRVVPALAPRCSILTPMLSRCRTPTRMCKPMKCYITFVAASAVAAASKRRRSRFIRAAFPTGRIRARFRPARR